MQQNAYFQLNIKSDGLYMIIYPPVDDGQRLTLFEINQYMDLINVTLFDSEILKQTLENQTEIPASMEIKLSDRLIEPVDEYLSVNISADNMSAFIKIYPASNWGEQFSKKSMLEKISEAGLKYGINEKVIDDWLQNKQYCTDILIAEGTAAEESIDAVIEYKFDTSKDFSPAVDRKDNIDFHQLNLIEHVAAGDELAVLTPAYEGKRGTNVLGMDIPSAKPLKKALQFEKKNAELSDDGCVLTAKVTGHVELLDEKVVVHNIYSVKSDVGTATGDIDYDGTVMVS